MILKCPKCRSTEHLQIERRPNGDIKCMNCNTKGKRKDFNYRVQHLEKIFGHISELADKDLRIGQIFKIIDLSLKKQQKDIFYIENDEFLERLKRLI